MDKILAIVLVIGIIFLSMTIISSKAASTLAAQQSASTASTASIQDTSSDSKASTTSIYTPILAPDDGLSNTSSVPRRPIV